ncbi:MAG: response regulator, partial [Candidatus Gastranaerophilales bacterium]|nr:response regulator [Candidatus Gastranaerophilales bacterium]
KHNPDLVTMDIIMPNGDGLTAIKQIMQHNIMAKIIVCTELAQNNMVIKSIQAGAKNFVTKPIDEKPLIKAVNSALSSNVTVKKSSEEIKKEVDKSFSVCENTLGSSKNTVSISITDNSLCNAGIFRNDLLIIDKEAKIDNNDLVAATYEGRFIFGYARILGNGQVVINFANEHHKSVKIMESDMLGAVTVSIRKIKQDVCHLI